MIFMYEFMQRIVIRNLTNHVITNINLTHDGIGGSNYFAKINELKEKESKETELYTLRAKDPCNLILTYTYKGQTRKVIVHNKLKASDLRLISISIKEVDGKIVIRTIIDNDLWQRY